MSSDKLRFHNLAANGTESTVLNLIRDYEPISRTRIASLGRLPQAAVSRATAKLLVKKIITESIGADKNGPRKKRGLRLNPSAGYVFSIEYGPQGLEGAIVNTAYKTMSTLTEEISMGPASRDEKLQSILSFVERLQKAVPCDDQECLGLAAVDPGAIDPVFGQTLMSTTMADWDNVPIVRILDEQLGLPILLLNSSTAKIRAIDQIEVRGRVSNLLYIEYGQGIACGLKLGNRYIQGKHHLAGELGHLRVTDQQVMCRCGSVGCLEAVAAMPALAKQAQMALTENTQSILAGKDKSEGSEVLEAAAKGDRLATNIVDVAFEYLGSAIGGLVNILDPETIVLDNTLSRAGPKAIEVLMRALNKRISAFHAEDLEIRVSSIESYVGALGGASALLDRCLGISP